MKRSTETDPLWTPPPVDRSEWLLVGLLVVLGTVLRCWQPSHMAVEHFDEGVYASNFFFPPGENYPFRHLYAPPLLPALLEWCLILTGGSAGSVMAVNVVAGCVMVPSVWWIGRAWFGPIAGVTAAALATFSEVHVLYSRTALTDGLLCLWMLWGVYWAWRAIHEGTPADVLLAALFASLAWWTKYNGWLTLAISGAGLLAWLVDEHLLRKRRFAAQDDRFAAHMKCAAKRPLSYLLRWLSVVVLTLLAWLPYLSQLQDRGGYAAVAANHARYFVGFSGWWDGLLRQTANLADIETWRTGAGLLAAITLAVAMLFRQGHRRVVQSAWARRVGWLLGALITLTVASLAISGLAGLTALTSLIAWIGLAISIVRPSVSRETRLAVWMLAAWLFGLFLAVPLYHPYPRLTLPFVVACWLGCGLAFSHLRPKWLGLSPQTNAERVSASVPRQLGIGLVLVAFCVVLLMGRSGSQSDPPAWEDRRSLQRIAAEIMQALPTGEDQLISVVGEPGLYYHLAALRRGPDQVIVPWSDLSDVSTDQLAGIDVVVYAVVGSHSEGTVASEASLVGEWHYLPSRLVLLNKYAPATIAAGEVQPETIQLLRFDPE